MKSQSSDSRSYLWIAVIILITLLHLHSRISAQVVTDAMKPNISNWQSKQDRFVFDLNFDNWDEKPPGVELKGGRSRGVNIMFTDEKQFGAGNVALSWGIGFSSQNFHTNAAYYQDDNVDTSGFIPIADSIEYDLNKLSVNYLDIPIELRFRTNANAKGNRLKLALGFKFGILVNAHTKFDDGETKFKRHRLDNIPDVHYGLTARLGFGRIGVSYFQSLTTLFGEDEGMEIHPYSIGISFTP